MRRLHIVALALACSSLWADRASAQAPVKLEVLGGTAVSTASDSATGVSPFARINFAMPLADWTCGDGWDCAPRFHFRIDLGGTPSEIVDLSDPGTFRSIDFAGGVSQRVIPSLYLALYCEAGATTLFGETHDAGALRWGGCGVRLDHFGRGWLNAIVTADQRLGGGLYRPAVAIQGSLAIIQADGRGRLPKGTTLALVGTAVFGVNSASWAPGSPTSLISTGISVGYGR